MHPAQLQPGFGGDHERHSAATPCPHQAPGAHRRGLPPRRSRQPRNRRSRFAARQHRGREERATIHPDGSMIVTPAWLSEALADRNGRREHTHSEFSHLHRRLGKGEAIPRAPSLLEQVVGLSHMLAQHPLSQQEEEALRGEEDQALAPAGPEEGGAAVENEEAAFV